MGTYQGNRKIGQAILQSAVPTEDQRAGNLSQKTDGTPEVPITDPSTGQPFPNNVIPSSRFSDTTQRILKFYPLPNQAGGVNLRRQFSTNSDSDSGLFKLDHAFTQNNRFSARYALQQTDGNNLLPLIADFSTRVPTGLRTSLWRTRTYYRRRLCWISDFRGTANT